MRKRCIISAAAFGAMVMYLFDPDRGKARRVRFRDRSEHVARNAWRWLRNSAVSMVNRMAGGVSEYQARVYPEPVSDDVLVERVRSRMGHVVRHPHQVDVSAEAGWIRLRGRVDPFEKAVLVDTISGIPGVFGITDDLQEDAVSSARPAMAAAGV